MAQLGRLAGILEAVDPPLHEKLCQVSNKEGLMWGGDSTRDGPQPGIALQVARRLCIRSCAKSVG